MPELIPKSRTQDGVFASPHTDTSEALFESQMKFNPVEIKLNLPDSVDQEQPARANFEKIVQDLIESEKEYLVALGNVQVGKI